jgi:hypothetical protein
MHILSPYAHANPPGTTARSSHNCSGWLLEGRLTDVLFARAIHLARRVDSLAAAAAAAPPPPPPSPPDAERLERLERRVEALAAEVAQCRVRYSESDADDADAPGPSEL